MDPHNLRLFLLTLISVIHHATAISGRFANKKNTFLTTTAPVASPSYITEISAATGFDVTCANVFNAGLVASVASDINIQTFTTIQPVATAYPATVVQTIIVNQTSAGHGYYNPTSDVFWIGSTVSTLASVTTVLLSAPVVTPFVTPVATGTLNWCPPYNLTKSGTYDAWTACGGAVECFSTVSGELFGLIP